MTTAVEIVASAREGDDANPGVVALLETDRELARLVAVWANVPIPADPDPYEDCPADLPVAMHLRWVWSRLEPDPIPTWIIYAGLPDAPHVRRAVALAIDNRVVFPDGTLSSWARVYVQRQARVALGVREPRQESTPAPVAPAPEPEPVPVDDGAIRPGRRLRGPGDRE